MPRYKLKPGMQLTYEGQTQVIGSDGSACCILDHRHALTVLAGDTEAGWRVLLISERREVDADPASGSQRKPRFDAAVFHLQPDGQTDYAQPRNRTDPNAILVPLPPMRKTTWQGTPNARGEWCRFHLRSPADAAVIELEAGCLTPLDDIYRMTHTNTFHFNTERGLVERIDSAMKTETITHASAVKLAGIAQLSVEQLEPLAHEVALFNDEQNKLYGLADALWVDPTGMERKLDDMTQILRQARRRFADDSPLVPPLNVMLRELEQVRSYSIDQEKRRQEAIGTPAPDWKLQDLQGHTHSLVEQRGKVVLLDFWEISCSWCVLAMLQINRLAQHYAGKPVAIFGMHDNSQCEEAMLVEQRLALKYPNLQATGMDSKYGLSDFQAHILIDPQGHIADIRCGWSPTLYEDFAATIDKLLAD